MTAIIMHLPTDIFKPLPNKYIYLHSCELFKYVLILRTYLYILNNISNLFELYTWNKSC